MALETSSAPDETLEEYKQSIQRLFEDRKDADLTLVCGGASQKVHSFVLWPRSTYFHTLCKGEFQEAKTMRVELKEEDPFLIERLLRYCYMLAWSESKMPGEQQWISRYSTVVMMYAIGDKYDIRGLKQESERRFAACLREMHVSVVEINSFLQAVSLVYTMTPDCDRGLRDQAAVFGRENWARFCLVPDFKDNLSRYYDFVSDIVTERGAPSEEGKTCISCDSSLFYGYHYCVDCGEVYEDSRE